MSVQGTQMASETTGGLDLPEGHGVTRAEWWFHRIGWLLFASIILAALAGLLGPGPMSAQTAAAPPLLKVDYNAFVRRHSPETLRVQYGSGSVRRSVAVLYLNSAFLEAIELTSVQPEPREVALVGSRHRFTFDVPHPVEPTTIIFRYQPERSFARVPVRVALQNGPTVVFSQVTYP
jgi:hypothetical protein